MVDWTRTVVVSARQDTDNTSVLVVDAIKITIMTNKTKISLWRYQFLFVRMSECAVRNNSI